MGWIACLLVAIGLFGCERNLYDVQLTPEGDQVERRLTVRHEGSGDEESERLPVPQQELDILQRVYGPPIAAAEDKGEVTFLKKFRDTLPDDIGGTGEFERWETSLGTLWIYVERIRGTDDLLDDLQARQQACDEVSELLTDWFAAELQGSDSQELLTDRRVAEFNRDLKNFSLYLWIHEIAASQAGEVQPEYLVRIGQYLVEHDYLAVDDVPFIMRAFEDSDREKYDGLMKLVRQIAATRFDLPIADSLPEDFAFLADAETASTSLQEFLAQRPDYREELRQWQQLPETDDRPAKPEPLAVLLDQTTLAFIPQFYLGRLDEAKVAFRTHRAPFLTNGQWIEADALVQWTPNFLPRSEGNTGLPNMLFAFWSEAAREAQTERFGQVLLDGQELGLYCLWYHGLTAAEAQEWEAFLNQLPSEGDLPQAFDTFRFSDDAATDAEGISDLAAPARSLLLKALQEP